MNTNNPFLKDGEYDFVVYGNPPPDQKRSEAIIHDWISRELDRLFSTWEELHPNHGLTGDKLQMRKQQLFVEHHKERHIKIADMGLDL